MTDLTIRDVFDLPPTIPRCIVKIQDFDDEQTLQENIRDYVITDTVAAEMERLVNWIVTSNDAIWVTEVLGVKALSFKEKRSRWGRKKDKGEVD